MSMVNILSCFQFVYMAKGRETMVNENTREEVTASDGLQLGHTSAEPTDMPAEETQKKNVTDVRKWDMPAFQWGDFLMSSFIGSR